MRHNKLVRDEELGFANQEYTLLDQIRQADKQDKTLGETKNNLEEAKKKQVQSLKDQQQRMHQFVKDFMRSPTKKMKHASPTKIQKTGNLVLDRINDEINQ